MNHSHCLGSRTGDALFSLKNKKTMEKLKTVSVTVLVCVIVALSLYIRFEQGAYKGMEDNKNQQITQLQEQLKVAQDLK